MSASTAGSDVVTHSPSPDAEPDLTVVIADLDAANALLESEEANTPRLSASDRLRIDRLSGDPIRQSHWRAARIATRIVLERAIGHQIRGADFEIASGGRPHLGQGLPHFNVSHTASVALIAVCRSSPVGVDIECQRTLSISPERRRRLVSAAAGIAGAGAAAADPQNDDDVLRAWVRLEAVAKARGSGIGVLLTEEGVIGSASGTLAKLAKAAPAVRDIDVAAPFIAAVAANALPATIIVERLPVQAGDLQKFLRRSRD